VSDPAELQEWLDEAINVDVTHAVFPVQEEFAIGLSEVARARAADKVVLGTKDVAEKTGRALGTAATAVGVQVRASAGAAASAGWVVGEGPACGVRQSCICLAAAHHPPLPTPATTTHPAPISR
jgi:hypothetical protein